LTRKKPKTIDELFHELEEYIMSDDDHHRRVAERNEARQGNKKQRGDLSFRIHETLTTWKIINPFRTIDQTQEEDLHLGEEEGEGEVDPRNSQTTTREIHTSTASITEEVITPKGA
jgi:hypothetical protein